MARIILKSPYMKPSDNAHLQKYLNYIATRHGVERLPTTEDLLPVTNNQAKIIDELALKYPDIKEYYEYEDYRAAPNRENAGELIISIGEAHPELFISRKGYIDYMANRPRAEKFSEHGLFSATDAPVDLKQVMEKIENYPGNIWTHIISLRREDAARLGYDSAMQWRELLRRNELQIAAAMKIHHDNFRWYAAFHNEGHHPHVHMVAYSSDPKEAYLNKDGIATIKSLLAKDIFHDDLLNTYQKETKARDELRHSSKDIIKEVIDQIERGEKPNPLLERMLITLHERLEQTKGKKVYGYLPPGTKKLVDAITDELGRDQRIATLYDAWYEQRFDVVRTYKDTMPEKIPLSQNKEFKSIRNAVIAEALRMTPAQEEPDETTPPPPLPIDEDIIEPDLPPADAHLPEIHGKKNTLWTDAYREARKKLYGAQGTSPDFDAAFLLMSAEAKHGNPLAEFDLGKMQLDGLGCEKNETIAQLCFKRALAGFRHEEAMAEKKGYLQYRIGKMHAMGYGTEQDYSAAASWYEKAVAEENPFAAYALGSLCLRGQGVPEDPEKALRLFHIAAEDEKSPNAYAMYELAKMYRDGVGTEADPETSESWFREAYSAFCSIEASRPDDKLQYRLGWMNLKGIGTPKNKDLAGSYFRKSATLENEDATYALGRLCLDREYSGFNPQQAISLLEKSAIKFHNTQAAYLLGKLFAKGELVPKKMEYALPFLHLAADADNPYALYLLGKIYYYGDDIPHDPELGIALLQKSADLGNSFAQLLLNKIQNSQAPSSGGYIVSGAIGLLRQVCNIFEDKLRYQDTSPIVDSKLRREINEKKLAHGQKIE